MTHSVYVYGTLRPRTGEHETYMIPGKLYHLGGFPGVILGGDHTVVCNRLLVTADHLRNLDHYEGYHADDPDNSLYIRRPMLDGWIYEYNRSIEGCPVIPTGDWFKRDRKANG